MTSPVKTMMPVTNPAMSRNGSLSFPATCNHLIAYLGAERTVEDTVING